ncbi:UNVERIFIED_CONTAM: hypothetical protein K2H54_064885 [Gekko kuhli]
MRKLRGFTVSLGSAGTETGCSERSPCLAETARFHITKEKKKSKLSQKPQKVKGSSPLPPPPAQPRHSLLIQRYQTARDAGRFSSGAAFESRRVLSTFSLFYSHSLSSPFLAWDSRQVRQSESVYSRENGTYNKHHNGIRILEIWNSVSSKLS